MDVSDPTRAITPTLDGPVLAVLAAAGRPLTVGEVAQLSVRGSEIGIRKCLGRLVQQGIVRTVEMGHSRVHELNREHVAAGIAVALSDLRLEFIRRLRAELASWKPRPIAAWLFGSTARADGDENSDVDLLLVRGLRRGETVKLFDSPRDGAWGIVADLVESFASSRDDEQNAWLKPKGEATWSAQLDRLHHLVPAWTGNRAQIVELTTNELAEQCRRNVALIDEIKQEGVPLVEQPLIQLQIGRS